LAGDLEKQQRGEGGENRGTRKARRMDHARGDDPGKGAHGEKWEGTKIRRNKKKNIILPSVLHPSPTWEIQNIAGGGGGGAGPFNIILTGTTIPKTV